MRSKHYLIAYIVSKHMKYVSFKVNYKWMCRSRVDFVSCLPLKTLLLILRWKAVSLSSSSSPYPNKWGRYNMFSTSILFDHSLALCTLLIFLLISYHPSHSPSIFSLINDLLECLLHSYLSLFSLCDFHSSA
jgi:hypothetical protein